MCGVKRKKNLRCRGEIYRVFESVKGTDVLCRRDDVCVCVCSCCAIQTGVAMSIWAELRDDWEQRQLG